MIFKKKSGQHTITNNMKEEQMDYIDEDQQQEYLEEQAEEAEVAETGMPRQVSGGIRNQKQPTPPAPQSRPATASAGPGRPKQQATQSDDTKYGLSAKIDRDLSSRIKFYAYIKGKTLAQLIEEWIVLYCPELPDNIR